MKVTFQGDVHGEFQRLAHVRNPKLPLVIQVGDLGLGFPKEIATTVDRFVSKPKNFRFIRGNHDNPSTCRNNPNYLGEFGTYGEIFFISGAWSIDKEWRMPGLTWWDEEELTFMQQRDCLDLYASVRPRVVVTHECPAFIHPNYAPNSTSRFFDHLWALHKPEIWIFGHHHECIDMHLDRTRFKGLNIDECFEYDIDTNKRYAPSCGVQV
jgi:hypothetical protein